jgi:hypothetical protein
MDFYIIKMYDDTFKIGFLSYQYLGTGVSCIVLLADKYILGDKPPYGPKVINEFATFEEAKKAVDMLTKPEEVKNVL